MNTLLGIDLGSTSIKAIVYDECGKVLAQGSRPMRRFHPNKDRPEWTVWEPAELWNETAAACRDAVSQLSDPGSIKGIATTGMGMDGLPMTQEGEALYPLISWHDPRTQPQYDWWCQHITSDLTYSIGGNPVWAINSALRIRWIMENEPEIFAKTFKWLLIEDYLNHCLTGKFATDYSMASCTMLFDQQTQQWSDRMIQLSGIPKSILPDPMPSGTFVGELTREAATQTGLPQGIPVFLGGHDHICSSLPVGAFRPEVVLNITGTWEMVDVVASRPPLDTPLGRSGISTQSHVIPNRYMIWSGNHSGEILEWYRRNFAINPLDIGATGNITNAPIPWETMIQLAQSSPSGSDGVLFLPHLGGASGPQVDPRSRGIFAGINSRTNQSHLVRAIFEGLGYQLLDVLSTIEKGTGKKAKEVIGVGGAVRNQFWMQNKADIIGCPVAIPEVEEATVLGAAILAGIGAGIYRDADDAFERIAPKVTYYYPNETLSAFYAEMFAVYRELYPAMAPINHQLFDRFALKN